MSRRTWRSAELLDVETAATGLVISFERCLTENPVLQLRAREITQALLRLAYRPDLDVLASAH